jgi:hypothetical protein
MVLNHDQENGSMFWRSNGESSASSGFSYTGITTMANLCFKGQRCQDQAENNILGMTKDRTTLIEEIINAEFDASFYDPPKRAVVVIYGIVYKEWVVRTKRRI